MSQVLGILANKGILRACMMILIILAEFHVIYSQESNNKNNEIPVAVKQKLLTGQFETAAKELSTLAKSGNSEAQYQLALLLLEGRGVEQKPQQAEKWLQRSAQSSADSAYLLGTLYSKGKQLKQNRSSAIKYLKIASGLGNKKASFQLKKMTNNPDAVSDKVQADFIEAIGLGKLSKVKTNYQLGVNLNKSDKSGYTPLMLAIKDNHADIIQWLLQKPVKLHNRDKLGNTALHLASDKGQLKTLIALSTKIKNLDPVNNKGQTPLILAVIKGKKDIAQWLINKDASPSHKDQFNKSAEIYAKQNKLKLIYKVSSEDEQKEKNRITNNQVKHQLKVLNNQVQNEKSLYFEWPILHIAVAQKQSKLILPLLQKGKDPWQLNPNGVTALEIAMHTNQMDVFTSMLSSNPVNAERDDKSIKRLLMNAIKMDKLEFIKKYYSQIKAKGEQELLVLEAINNNNLSALNYILGQRKQQPTGKMLHQSVQMGSPQIVASLLINKAPANWKDTEGRNALWFAAEAGNNEILELLTVYGANVNNCDNNHQCPLMRVIVNSCVECAKLLLDAGADLQLVTNTGNTAVMLAAQYSDPVLKLLLNKKTDLAQRNNQTLTALMLAIKSGNAKSVKTLLIAGANPRRRDEQGQDSFDFAKGKPDIQAILKDYD